MTLAEAVLEMNNGDAAVRPSWRGYVYMTDRAYNASGVMTQCLLVFVTREADMNIVWPQTNNTNRLTDDKGCYIFSYHDGEWHAPGMEEVSFEEQTPHVALAIDGQLFAGLISADWVVTTQAAAEQNRTGTGTRW